MIKNIVFDMGNVLVDYNAHRFVANHTTDPDDAVLLRQTVFGSVAWIQLDRGSISRTAAAERICGQLPPRLQPVALQLLENWHDDIRPFAAMEQLCCRLQQAGYQLWLLSNAGLQFYDYCRSIGALRYFSGTFVSADYGLLKPDPAIYTAFCNRFGLLPEQCLFVDDMPLNVEGALRAGMPGLVYHGDAALLQQQLVDAGVVFAATQE